MFDSLKCAKKLEEAGVPRAQAEAHVLVISEFMETNFATNKDLLGLRQEVVSMKQELKQDIALLSQEISHSEHRMIIRLGALMAALISIGTAVIALLIQSH